MKKILFPIDFSENSLNAFRYALHLADNINAEIITLHVYDGPEGFYQEYYDFLVENYTIMDWSEFENYKSEVPKLNEIADKCQLSHIKVSHVLERGIPVKSILEMAAAEKADYIVMGTTGASGLKEAFFGSVTEKVINESRVPVLSVPSDCFYIPIKHILFLCRYKDSETDILKNLLILATLLGAQVDVLRVQPHHSEDESDVVAKWKAMFHKTGTAFYNLTSSDYEGTVIDFVKLNRENLVVMPRHHKTFLDKLLSFSLSRNLVFHSTVPLLAIPV